MTTLENIRFAMQRRDIIKTAKKKKSTISYYSLQAVRINGDDDLHYT
jgi:hypothetical protein